MYKTIESTAKLLQVTYSDFFNVSSQGNWRARNQNLTNRLYYRLKKEEEKEKEPM